MGMGKGHDKINVGQCITHLGSNFNIFKFADFKGADDLLTTCCLCRSQRCSSLWLLTGLVKIMFFFELLLRKSDPTIIPPKLGFCDQ